MLHALILALVLAAPEGRVEELIAQSRGTGKPSHEAVQSLAALGRGVLPRAAQELAEHPENARIRYLFVRLGTPSVPVLARALDDERSRLPAALALGQVARHQEDRSDARPFADVALPVLRAHAQRIVPLLVAAVARQETRYDAIGALQSVGADAVPAVVRLLADGALAMSGVQILAEIGPHAAPAIPHLVPLLRHANRDLASWAAAALGAIGAAARPALLAAFEETQTQELAARGLARLPAPSADLIVPVLVESAATDWHVTSGLMLGIGEPAIRYVTERARAGDESAIRALGRMASTARSNESWASCWGTPAKARQGRQRLDVLTAAAVPALAAVPVPARDYHFYWTLSQFGAAALPQLTASASSPEAETRRAAVVALPELGTVAFEVLLQATKDADTDVRDLAWTQLARSDARRAMPVLVTALSRDQEPCVRLVEALGQAAAAAELGATPEAVRQLTRRLSVAPCRRAASEALARMGAVDPLVAALREPDRAVAWAAARALAFMREKAVPALRALIEALGDPASREPALEALAALGPAAGTAVPAVLPLLRDPALAWPASRVLAGIGPAAIPGLLAALGDPATEEVAVVTLGRIGLPAREALEPLRVRAASPNARLAAAATVAVARVEEGSKAQ